MADAMPATCQEYFCYQCNCRVLYIGNPGSPNGKPACHRCGETARVRAI